MPGVALLRLELTEKLDAMRPLVRKPVLQVEQRVVEIKHQQVLACSRRVHGVDFGIFHAFF